MKPRRVAVKGSSLVISQSGVINGKYDHNHYIIFSTKDIHGYSSPIKDLTFRIVDPVTKTIIDPFTSLQKTMLTQTYDSGFGAVISQWKEDHYDTRHHNDLTDAFIQHGIISITDDAITTYNDIIRTHVLPNNIINTNEQPNNNVSYYNNVFHAWATHSKQWVYVKPSRLPNALGNKSVSQEMTVPDTIKQELCDIHTSICKPIQCDCCNKHITNHDDLHIYYDNKRYCDYCY